jgi:hypothetical protein
MKLTLPNITIIEMDGAYRFIGVLGGLHLSLGAYGSLKEGVHGILEKGNTKLEFLTQLEQLWRKGMEVEWDEEKLFAQANVEPAHSC